MPFWHEIELSRLRRIVNLLIEKRALLSGVIKLRVEFASDSSTISNARIDTLFDWAEKTYPGVFPGHQSSIEILGYHARAYPGDTYLGVKD